MDQKAVGIISQDYAIGDLIAKLRTKSGLSIAKLAARVGVNAAYFAQVEQGTRIPSDEMIRNLAEYFKLDENMLFEMVGKVPLAAREELENQTLLQNVLKEITKIKISEQEKQDIYREFLQIVKKRVAYSA